MNDKRFAFGKNWKRYLGHFLTENRIRTAMASLSDLLLCKSFEGKTFLDIGCGSGLFSLSAFRLKADRVVSFDIDTDSVNCATQLRQREGNPKQWDVLTGSILDEHFCKGLGTFDIVYSWGVLHHTGQMWKAIDNAAGMVSEAGLFCVAIYNKAEALGIYPDGRFGPSALWVPLKRMFASFPELIQDTITALIFVLFMLACVTTLRNPFRMIRNYQSMRGMSLFTDIKDWFGGFPYEFASIDEIFKHVARNGFTLVNLSCNKGLMCNEFVFRKNNGQTALEKERTFD